MAVVKKLAGKPAKAAPTKLTINLPDAPSEPSESLADYSILLYGVKKGGKTTLCSQFPDPFFIGTEPGTKALRVKRHEPKHWLEAVAILEALEAKSKAGAKYCSTVIVDIVDVLYDMAFHYICKKKMISHPHEENDFGATWNEIRAAFRDYIVRLLQLPDCGVVFVSHDVEKEVELADGDKVERTQPSMSGQALREVEGIVDIIGHYTFAPGGQRILRIRGTQHLVAGTRLRERFVVAGGDPDNAADRVQIISMGGNEREAYANLVAAFNNEQADNGLSLVHVEEKSVVKKKVLIKKGGA